MAGRGRASTMPAWMTAGGGDVMALQSKGKGKGKGKGKDKGKAKAPDRNVISTAPWLMSAATAGGGGRGEAASAAAASAAAASTGLLGVEAAPVAPKQPGVKYLGISPPISITKPSPADTKQTAELDNFLQENHRYESHAGKQHRELVLTTLNQILTAVRTSIRSFRRHFCTTYTGVLVWAVG